MAENPLVSIIVRARNEAPALRKLFPLLQHQHTDFAYEIWLLDNDSSDGSAELAHAAGVEVHHIPRDAFNYASALNQGMALARGEYVVSLSAHCYPLSETWLADLVRPLREDRAVVATYGRQWADPRVAPFEALGNDALFPPPGRAPAMVAFSNANSAVRRSFLLLHPYNPMVKILEDHLLYLETSGEHQFVYVPEALVYHAHERFSLGYHLRRWMREGWAFFFITQHRGYASPMIPKRLVSVRELFWSYPWLAAVFTKRRRFGVALLTIPFFWARDMVWMASYVRARLQQPLISQHDTALLTRTNSRLADQVLRGGASAELQAPLDWPEEWQLKADWGFIRRNIAEFIRGCHERGLIASPLLEVGASGQNDYLGEWYELTSSNLASNMQTAEVPLDMEDMYSIPDHSLGTVLCSEVIEHVRHPERAFREAFRVLRPGGTLIITTPYSIVIHNTEDDGGFHGRNFTPQGLELLATEAGFNVELLETRGQSELRRRLMPSNVFLVARKP